MHYDFTTLPLEGNNPKKFDHVLLGSERVLKEIRTSDTPTYDILRDSNEYDISFVVSPKDSPEQGVVSLEYLVLMTSRRELFPKLTADLSFSKKSPSSSSLASINGTRKGPLAETEAAEQGKGTIFCITAVNLTEHTKDTTFGFPFTYVSLRKWRTHRRHELDPPSVKYCPLETKSQEGNGLQLERI